MNILCFVLALCATATSTSSPTKRFRPPVDQLTSKPTTQAPTVPVPDGPTEAPTKKFRPPLDELTKRPTGFPTMKPTKPTMYPTKYPTSRPTSRPTKNPTFYGQTHAPTPAPKVASISFGLLSCPGFHATPLDGSRRATFTYPVPQFTVTDMPSNGVIRIKEFVTAGNQVSSREFNSDDTITTVVGDTGGFVQIKASIVVGGIVTTSDICSFGLTVIESDDTSAENVEVVYYEGSDGPKTISASAGQAITLGCMVTDASLKVTTTSEYATAVRSGNLRTDKLININNAELKTIVTAQNGDVEVYSQIVKRSATDCAAPSFAVGDCMAALSSTHVASDGDGSNIVLSVPVALNADTVTGPFLDRQRSARGDGETVFIAIGTQTIAYIAYGNGQQTVCEFDVTVQPRMDSKCDHVLINGESYPISSSFFKVPAESGTQATMQLVPKDASATTTPQTFTVSYSSAIPISATITAQDGVTTSTYERKIRFHRPTKLSSIVIDGCAAASELNPLAECTYPTDVDTISYSIQPQSSLAPVKTTLDSVVMGNKLSDSLSLVGYGMFEIKFVVGSTKRFQTTYTVRVTREIPDGEVSSILLCPDNDAAAASCPNTMSCFVRSGLLYTYATSVGIINSFVNSQSCINLGGGNDRNSGRRLAEIDGLLRLDFMGGNLDPFVVPEDASGVIYLEQTLTADVSNVEWTLTVGSPQAVVVGSQAWSTGDQSETLSSTTTEEDNTIAEFKIIDLSPKNIPILIDIEIKVLKNPPMVTFVNNGGMLSLAGEETITLDLGLIGQLNANSAALSFATDNTNLEMAPISFAGDNRDPTCDLHSDGLILEDTMSSISMVSAQSDAITGLDTTPNSIECEILTVKKQVSVSSEMLSASIHDPVTIDLSVGERKLQIFGTVTTEGQRNEELEFNFASYATETQVVFESFTDLDPSTVYVHDKFFQVYKLTAVVNGEIGATDQIIIPYPRVATDVSLTMVDGDLMIVLGGDGVPLDPFVVTLELEGAELDVTVAMSTSVYVTGTQTSVGLETLITDPPEDITYTVRIAGIPQYLTFGSTSSYTDTILKGPAYLSTSVVGAAVEGELFTIAVDSASDIPDGLYFVVNPAVDGSGDIEFMGDNPFLIQGDQSSTEVLATMQSDGMVNGDTTVTLNLDSYVPSVPIDVSAQTFAILNKEIATITLSGAAQIIFEEDYEVTVRTDIPIAEDLEVKVEAELTDAFYSFITVVLPAGASEISAIVPTSGLERGSVVTVSATMSSTSPEIVQKYLVAPEPLVVVVAAEKNYPDSCENNPEFISDYGDCLTYSEAYCSSETDLACNFRYCSVDNADFNCPQSCNTCKSNDVNWKSQYGGCENYQKGYCIQGADCNWNHCNEDIDIRTGETAAEACLQSCGGPWPTPTVKYTMCGNIQDSPDFNIGYGGCETYRASLCGNDPQCNFNSCFDDDAYLVGNCPRACGICYEDAVSAEERRFMQRTKVLN